jgi:hypothetical protein
MRLPLIVGLFICATYASAWSAHAQPPLPKPSEPKAEPKAQPKGESCPAGCIAPRSAVDTLVRATVAGLGRIPKGAVIASTALASDEPAPRGDGLSALLAEHVAGRLGDGMFHDAQSKTIAEARKRARRAPAIVLLRPRIAQGRLHLRADVYPTRKTVWSRARAPASGPVAHSYAHAPLDAEVRSYLEPVTLEDPPKVSKYQEADPDILALACGDLDGDGVSELVSVTRRRVLAVRLSQGKVVRLREARWDDLAPIAPVPLRQPLGFATIVEPVRATGRGGYIDVSLTDRSGSVRLDDKLKLVKRMQGKALPVAHATGCSWVVDLLLAETLFACDERDPAIAQPELAHRSDAFASTYLVGADGNGRTVFGLRREGALVVRQNRDDTVIGRVGAQLSIGDLDQDGALELISTMDVLAPRFDMLEVRTLLPSGTVKPRFKLPVPTGVQALAACPPDSTRRAPIVLATHNELWVVR